MCVAGNSAVSRVWRRCRRRSSANNWTREVNELIASHQYDAYELRKSQSAYSHTGSMIINSSRVITKRWKIIVITRTKCERMTPGQTRRRHLPRPLHRHTSGCLQTNVTVSTIVYRNVTHEHSSPFDVIRRIVQCLTYGTIFLLSIINNKRNAVTDTALSQWHLTYNSGTLPISCDSAWDIISRLNSQDFILVYVSVLMP